MYLATLLKMFGFFFSFFGSQNYVDPWRETESNVHENVHTCLGTNILHDSIQVECIIFQIIK